MQNKKPKSNFLQATSSKLKAIEGAMTLPVVLVISAILMTISVSIVLVSTSLTNTSFNARLNAELYTLALAGAEDGILRVIRYCPIISASIVPQCASAYTIDVNGRSVTVSIKDDSRNTANRLVLAVASISGRIKRVQAELVVDPKTGKTEVKSIAECYTSGTPTCL